jgi:hypothetical protein
MHANISINYQQQIECNDSRDHKHILQLKHKNSYLQMDQSLCISFIIINIYHHHHRHYHNIIIIIMMLYSSYASSCISLPLYLSNRSIILSCSNWCMRSTSSSAMTNSQHIIVIIIDSYGHHQHLQYHQQHNINSLSIIIYI